ncbi:site-specific integrase [Caulobacter sp. S45]|uniref:tyrosine-type recombinase/integrase n=1 Tax=Caulobacter sp. S45 TaxID=1641861 RepID=UPI00157739F5|nr:site-specific integrase [Caulobacter sp. S45]
MKVPLKGLNRVRKRRSDGSVAVYWYAWKGGPRLPGKPNEPEFIAAYVEAQKGRKAPRSDTLSGLVTLYKSKPEFLQLAASTRKEWTRWLDRIVDGGNREGQPVKTGLGALTFSALEAAAVRADLMDWRDQWAANPRTADYGVQVLSRVLGFAAERGVLSINRAAGIPHLYDVDRSDLVWEAAHIAAFVQAAPPLVSQAFRLACLTGLRRGDLVRMRWADVGDLAIILRTGKSRRRGAEEGSVTVTVPVLKETRDLLAEIGRREATATVLVSSLGQAWNANSLSDRVSHFAKQIGVELSLHDARGTFATRLCIAGLTDEEIADIMGWERDRVRRIRARYVDSERVVRALVQKLHRNEAGAQTPNFLPTRSSDES